MDTKVIPATLSDHDVISCNRKINNKKESSENIKCRNYANYQPEHLRNDLKQTSFDKVYNEKNPNKAWNALKSILVSSFNDHARLISKRVKGKKSPWLISEIKSEMNTRDALYRKYRKSKSTNDHEIYKKQRNKVNVSVRKAKNNHSKDMLRDSTHDPKTFWKNLKKIFPTKEKLSMTKTFLIDGSLTSNVSIVASKFCPYFSTIARCIKEKAEYSLYSIKKLYMVKAEKQFSKNLQHIQIQRGLR